MTRMGIAFMSNCKHKYLYLYEGIVRDFDIHAVELGIFKSTMPKIKLGESMAFYGCSKCGVMLLTERVK